MGVSKNNGTPKSSILIGFSIIKFIHFGGFTPIFGNTHIHMIQTVAVLSMEAFLVAFSVKDWQVKFNSQQPKVYLIEILEDTHMKQQPCTCIF